MVSDTQIAKRLGLSQSYFSKSYKWARKTRNNSRNNLGIDSSNLTSGSHIVPEHLKRKYKLRLFLHNLRRKYKLSRRLIPQGVQLHNTQQERFKIQGVSCILTSKHLIVEGIQEWGDLAEQAQALLKRAERKADAIASAAQRDRLPTLKLSTGITTKAEIALTDVDQARRLAERNKGKLILFENHEGTLYVDRTPRPAAFEAAMKDTTPRGSEAVIMERWLRLAKPVEEDRWNADKQLALNDSQLRLNDGYLANFNEVRDLLLELAIRVKRLERNR